MYYTNLAKNTDKMLIDCRNIPLRKNLLNRQYNSSCALPPISCNVSQLPHFLVEDLYFADGSVAHKLPFVFYSLGPYTSNRLQLFGITSYSIHSLLHYFQLFVGLILQGNWNWNYSLTRDHIVFFSLLRSKKLLQSYPVCQ